MKRRILSIFVALAMCVSLLPTVALADGMEIDPEGGNSIVFDGGGMNEPSDEPTDEEETKDFDEKDEPADPDEGEGAHECVFVDGFCECGKEEPATPPIAQPLGAYALHTMSIEPEGEPVVQDLQEEVKYLEKEGGAEKTCGNYKLVTSETASLGDGWYVVNTDVTISGTLKIASGATVHLILCDGATLTVKGGVKSEGTNENLSIYGQSKGTGEMNAQAGNSRNMAIFIGGNLQVNGGKVTATSENGQYGIYVVENLEVKGGEVKATAGNQTASETTKNFFIGINVDGAMRVSSGKVTGIGGAVNFTDTSSSYGRSSTGIWVDGNDGVTVSGGEVTAIGGKVTTTVGSGYSGTVASYGIYVKNGAISVSSGTLQAASGEVTKSGAGGTIESYDIYCNKDSMEVSKGTVQKTADGGAVKVWIKGSLNVPSENATIQLAYGSRINTSISVKTNDQFYSLVDGGCWYFKQDDTEITNITDTELSAGDGEGTYIIIEESEHTIPYLDKDGKTKNHMNPTKLTNDMATLGNGWYVVSENMAFDKKFEIKSGEVHLILCDGVTLTLRDGLESSMDLHIYGQSKGANVGKMVVYGPASGNDSIAINTSGSLEINSGIVTASGGDVTDGSSYGIKATSALTVYGGELTATGGNAIDTGKNHSSYGIYQNSSSNLQVEGGKVTATGGEAKYSYGIYKLNGGILIKGGTVEAKGGTATKNSYGIQQIPSGNGSLTVQGKGELTAIGGKVTVDGGGSFGINTEKDLTVKDTGELTATGGEAALSCGIYYKEKSLTVSGGTLTAKGGEVVSTPDNSNSAYGSFGIFMGDKGNFTVSGGEVIAEANTATFTGTVGGYSAGIYSTAKSGTLTVSGGEVKATGGNAAGDTNVYSYGISCTSLTVSGTGSVVTAKSGTAELKDGEGTGTAASYDINSSLTLSGGTVQSATGGAAVLLCANAENGSVTVSGGSMKLAENSVMQKVSVSGSVKLLDLVNEGDAYQKTTDNTFAEITDATTELTEVIVQACKTHSISTGKCAYCGKNITPAPTPGGGSSGGSSGGGSSSGSSSSGGSSATTTPTYSVSSSDEANGALSVSTENAKKGDIVTITVDPESGYTLETLQVLDENGNEIPLVDNGDGTFSFEMPAGEVEVKHTFAEDNSILNFFVDVPTDAYYYDAALWAAKNGVTGGIDENNFGPDLSCTRAQLVTFLWRAANKPVADYAMNFTDVREDAYYSEAIRWAASMDIVSGYGNGLFGTDDTITREQMAVILYRFAQAMGMDTTQGGMAIREFADYESISGYALEAMQWAVNAGIMSGYNNMLMPNQPCSRAQIVAMLYRMMGQA